MKHARSSRASVPALGSAHQDEDQQREAERCKVEQHRVILEPRRTAVISKRPYLAGPVAGSAPREIAREVLHDVAGIVLGTVDEARPAAAQHRQPEHDHPRAVDDDAPVVADVPFRVDDGNVQPAVVGAKAGRPEDRPDLAAAEIDPDARRFRRAGRLEAFRLADAPASSAPTRRRSRAAGSASGRQARTCSGARPRRAPSRRVPPTTRPTSSTPVAVSALRSSVVLGRADELGRGQAPGAGQIVDGVVRLVPHARLVHPPQHIASAVPAGKPDVLADRERHRAPRAANLVGELNARRRCADDEHAAVRTAARDRDSRTG